MYSSSCAPRWLRRPALVTVAAAMIAAAAVFPSCALAEDGWFWGRATFYGQDGGSTIHQGSCMMSLDGSQHATGNNVAALSDHNPDYADSCGRCYVVECGSIDLYDGYGQRLDRASACYSGRSVVVTITDTCPCIYPSNASSNKRWCCGDMPHFDLSTEAFAQLADVKHGVIGIKYKEVACPGPTVRTGKNQYANQANNIDPDVCKKNGTC